LRRIASGDKPIGLEPDLCRGHWRWHWRRHWRWRWHWRLNPKGFDAVHGLRHIVGKYIGG
jgi:hypothetical protein